MTERDLQIKESETLRRPSLQGNPISDYTNDEFLSGRDMQIAARPVMLHIDGRTETGAGKQLPFIAVEASSEFISQVESAAQKTSQLEVLIKQGFHELVTTNPDQAASLLRFSFNTLDQDDPYVDRMINAFLQNPKLILDTTHSYRADGRFTENGEVSFNEINANPGGISWCSRVARELEKVGRDTSNLNNLTGDVTNWLANHYPGSGVVFMPSTQGQSLSEYKVTTEMLTIAEMLCDRYGIDSIVGEPEVLQVDEEGVFVSFQGDQIRVGLIDGISSPTTFKNRPDLMDSTAEGRVRFPSLGATAVSLTNKGMYVLITAMRDERIDPGLLGLDNQQIQELSAHIPSTYWLSESVADSYNPKAIEMIRDYRAIIKPFDTAGGAGIILNPTVAQLDEVPHQNRQLVQEKLAEADINVRINGRRIQHKSSVDPYFSVNKEKGFQYYGSITRGSLPGTLTNASANTVADAKVDFQNHISVVIQ